MTAMTQQEQIKFWRDLHLENLELLRATYVTHTFSPHVHEGFAIGVVQRGITTTSYRNEHYDVPAGTIIVINPGELHTGEAASEQGWTYRMFYPRANLLQRIASDLADQPRDIPFFSSPVIYDDYLARSLLNLHLTLEEKNNSIVERESLFWWTMAQLIVRHADDSLTLPEVKIERNCVKEIRDYIEAHYADNISLQQLASLVNLNSCHLLRLFTKTIGLPPHAYLTQVRIRQAKRLLAHGCSIADAAYQTGFVDQSHMTKRFKRVFGITPGQYILSFN
jgi:AraC-like DNA-binding protein